MEPHDLRTVPLTAHSSWNDISRHGSRVILRGVNLRSQRVRNELFDLGQRSDAISQPFLPPLDFSIKRGGDSQRILDPPFRLSKLREGA